MKRFLFHSIAVLCSVTALSQTHVTFQLDAGPLMEAGYFRPDSGDRILVRGSFNQWEGDVYELRPNDGPMVYSDRYPLDLNPGDTLFYKFVIRRDPQRYYWEHRPAPENGPYGNRRHILTHREEVLPPAQFRFNEYIDYPVVFSKEKLQDDFLEFRRILEETHPALYDYTGKRELDSLFDSQFAQIDTSMEFEGFLMLMTEVIAKVGCGHSSMWIPRSYWNVAPAKLFPLKLYLTTGGKVYTTGSYLQKCGVPVGSEVLRINGKSIDSITDRLTSLQSADGFNRSYRLAKAGQHFSVRYALAYGFFDSFEVEYREPGEVSSTHSSLPPVDKAQVDLAKPGREELSLEVSEDTRVALLTINTFGYYGEVDMFRGFLDSTFQVLADKGIRKLILDLRGNSGGDPFCSSYLWAYLQPESLPYFEDHYGKYDTLANPVPVPKNHFDGRLLTLIDGNGFSTTGHFCGLLKYHGVGRFVGTELGSTYTCTGNATYPALEHTGIMVGTARVRRYTTAVKNMDPMRGIKPDYFVEPSQQDIFEDRDAPLRFAAMIFSDGN